MKHHNLFRSFVKDYRSVSWIERIGFAFILLTACLAFGYSIAGFPVAGFDASYHLDWIDQFREVQSKGVFYPRWLPHSFGGCGSCVFYIYPPFCHFLASAISAIIPGITAVGLYQSLRTISTLLSIITCAWYLKTYTSHAFTLAYGSLLYAFAPFVFFNEIICNAIGVHFALAWIPLVFCGIDKAVVAQTGRRARLEAFAISALAWALLLFTNIPSTIAAAIAALLYYLGHHRAWKRFGPAVAGSALAIPLVAIYLLPLVQYVRLVHTDEFFTHIVERVVKWQFLIEEVALGLHLRMLHIIGIGTILASGVGGFFLVRSRRIQKDSRTGPLALAWTLIIATLLFLQLPRIAAPFWEYVPTLRYVQFSWRLDIVLVIVPTIVAVLLLNREPTLSNNSSRFNQSFLAGVFLLLVSIFSFSCYAYDWYATITYPPPTPPPLARQQLRLAAGEDLPKFTRDIYSTIDYLLVHKDDPYTMVLGKRTALVVADSIGPTSITMRVNSPTPFAATIHQFYWPQWKLYRGTDEIFARPDSAGILAVEFPAGTYTAQLRLIKGWSEIWGARISLATLLILLAIIGVGFAKTRHESE